MAVSRGLVREVALLSGLLVVVVAGSAAAQQRQVPPATPLDGVGLVLVVAAVAVLAGRRWWPRSVLAATVVIVGVYSLLGYAYGPVLLTASVAIFALAGADSAAASAVAALGAVGLWSAAVAAQVVPADGWGSLAATAAGFAAWLILPAWWATVRARRRDAAVAAVESRRREFDEQRLELAREVHDVLAHSLTVIGVQTGAARRMLERDPQRAREALDTVVATNRHALAELREALDLMRDPDRPPGPGRLRDSDAAPVGGLAELPALIDSVRHAGTSVEFHALDPRGLGAYYPGPLVERGAYRIVQEALTNAVRHAPGAAVTVTLGHVEDGLLVHVSDDGPGLDGQPEGRGILGMRERAAAVGGSLHVAGNNASTGAGGVTVRATLPLGGAR